MQKIVYENNRGQSIELLSSPPFILTKLEGNGSPKTTMITTKAPGQDGVTREDTLLEEGVINLEGTIKGLSPEDVFKKWRQLCNIFNPKLTGTLTYTNDAGSYKINGSPEAVTPKQRFGNKLDFLIQLFCSDPYWYNIEEFKEEIAIWVGDFEFPLEITSEGIEMGHRVSSLIVNINNFGDAEIGMRAEFKALATVVNPSILNVYTQEFIKIKYTFEAGDKIVITTHYGNKTIQLIKNGISTNIFNYIDLQTTFLQLAVGDNLLRYNAESGIDNLELAIYFTPKYVGV